MSLTTFRVLVAAVALALIAPTAASAAGGGPGRLADGRAGSQRARASRSASVVSTIALRLVRRNGATLIHRGTATGTLPGRASGRFRLSGVRVAGRVRLRTSGGALTIRVRGRAVTTGINARFTGRIGIARGSGRYAGARGRGRFNGVVNRRSWAATVTATGRLAY